MGITRTIFVNTPAVVPNDTLTGYNIHSDKDGLLGNLTVANQILGNGLFVELSPDIHSITIIPVGLITGEHTTLVSDAISIDVRSELYQWDLVGFARTNLGLYAPDGTGVINNYAQGHKGTDGEFEFSVDTFTNTPQSYIDNARIGLTIGDNNVESNQWNISTSGIGANASLRVNNVLQTLDNPTTIVQKIGAKLMLIRDFNNTLTFVYRQKGLTDIVIHSILNFSGLVFPHFDSYNASATSNFVANPNFKIL